MDRNSALERVTGAAGALDALAGDLAEGVGVNCERLAQISLSQHLDRHTLAGSQALGLHSLQCDLGSRVEAALEVGDIHRLGVGAEHLEGHRLLHVRPAQLRMRMWIGIWPPSKRALSLEPEREPAPFWPLPAVLPVPEPSPRPTRLRGRRLPGAGLSECRPMGRSSFSTGFTSFAPPPRRDGAPRAPCHAPDRSPRSRPCDLSVAGPVSATYRVGACWSRCSSAAG